jgi:tRNA-specific 2-thiouridylase
MTHPLRFSEVPRPPRGTRVVLGLSGGVDSAVAAHRLREWGCEVVAITTRNFCFDEAPFDVAAATSSCCGLEAMEAAGAVASELSIPHRVLDVADSFGEVVVGNYRREYASGRTPNPCVRCNSSVRFPQLLRYARQVGADCVASGHYARQVDVDGARYVREGADSHKDQSYFLHRLDTATLERSVFPLGDLHKEEVREIARREGLPVAETPESQELCFVPDGDRTPLLGPTARPGEIVDEAGEVLGTHPGIEFFTLGQRRGLGLGGGRPWFVIGLDARTSRVVVGREEDLGRRLLCCEGSLLRDECWLEVPLRARTRYRHRGIDCARVEHDPRRETLQILLREADRAPAPGQSVVLYAGDVVVGGGILQRAERGEASLPREGRA